MMTLCIKKIFIVKVGGTNVGKTAQWCQKMIDAEKSKKLWIPKTDQQLLDYRSVESPKM